MSARVALRTSPSPRVSQKDRLWSYERAEMYLCVDKHRGAPPHQCAVIRSRRTSTSTTCRLINWILILIPTRLVLRADRCVPKKGRKPVRGGSAPYSAMSCALRPRKKNCRSDSGRVMLPSETLAGYQQQQRNSSLSLLGRRG